MQIIDKIRQLRITNFTPSADVKIMKHLHNMILMVVKKLNSNFSQIFLHVTIFLPIVALTLCMKFVDT